MRILRYCRTVTAIRIRQSKHCRRIWFSALPINVKKFKVKWYLIEDSVYTNIKTHIKKLQEKGNMRCGNRVILSTPVRRPGTFHIMMWRQGCDLAILAIVYPPCSITIYRVQWIAGNSGCGGKNDLIEQRIRQWGIPMVIFSFSILRIA